MPFCGAIHCPCDKRPTEGEGEDDLADEPEPVTWCEADEIGEVAADDCDPDEELSEDTLIEELIDAEE